MRQYLAVMQLRLGDRLRAEVDVAPSAAGLALPPGLLLTLVENAIEHGVQPSLGGAAVQVVARVDADARYTRVVHVSDGVEGEALIRTPLEELLAQLDERDFMQVHRSTIVHRRWIASAVRVDEGHMHLVLRGRPEKLPVSRPFQGLFKGQ